MTEHVLRRVEHALAGRLATVYAITGQQRYTSRAGRASAAEARALIGFHDGTANLDPAHNPDDHKLMFIDPDHVNYPPNPAPGTPGYGGAASFPPDLRPVPTTEPAWTAGATYMRVRASVFDTAAWDTTPLGQQEREVGRLRMEGRRAVRVRVRVTLEDESAEVEGVLQSLRDPGEGAGVDLVVSLNLNDRDAQKIRRYLYQLEMRERRKQRYGE